MTLVIGKLYETKQRQSSSSIFFPFSVSTVSRGYRKCNDNLSIQLYVFSALLLLLFANQSYVYILCVLFCVCLFVMRMVFLLLLLLLWHSHHFFLFGKVDRFFLLFSLVCLLAIFFALWFPGKHRQRKHTQSEWNKQTNKHNVDTRK